MTEPASPGPPPGADQGVTGLVTLVRDGTCQVAARDGGLDPGQPAGLFHRDVRVLSRLELSVDGHRPALLSYRADGPAGDSRLYAAGGSHPAARLLVTRSQRIEPETGALLDTFEFRAPSAGPASPDAGDAGTVVELLAESDFARLPALRYGTARPAAVPVRPADPAGSGCFAAAGDTSALRIETDPAAVMTAPGVLTWRVSPAADGGPATIRVRYLPSFRARPASAGPAAPVTGVPRRRLDGGPRVDGGPPGLGPAIEAGLADLAALQMSVPELGLSFCAAGAPWFLALFGRDSLLTGWEALPAGPGLAVQALTSLARFAGRADDPASNERPGRIPHEIRVGGTEYFGIPAGRPYYGSVDSSPLFVMLAAEAYRWGAEPGVVRDLLPAVREAFAWCVSNAGDEGYLTYPDAPAGRGLRNQGWKDSANAMMHADGEPVLPPIAPAEAQAYFWAAHHGLAHLEERLGDPAAAGPLRAAAARLRRSFHRDFWLPGPGLVAMARDGAGRPLAVAASNMAHCLWTGLLEDETGDRLAARLAAPDMATGFGLRTLGSGERDYNPVSYHNGSVWPHDTAIAVAGLAGYGHGELAAGYAADLLRAAAGFGFRLPEVFAGFGRARWPVPVRYPLACSPHAWSAASPLLLLRGLLRIDPDVPAGRVYIAPLLPDGVSVTVEGLSLGKAGTLDLRATGHEAEILGKPPGIEVIHAPRGPGGCPPG